MFNTPENSKPSRSLTFESHKQKQLGFTAIELMVVVSIVAVLAALAAPSFAPTIERFRVRQAVEEMTATLYFARSEAIKRGGNITVIKTDLSSDCPQATSATEWGCGWRVFVDTNNNGTQQSGEETIQTSPVVSSVNVVNTNNSGSTRFSVDRWGQINGLGAQGFRFVPTNTGISSPNVTVLCVSSGGRIRSSVGDVAC